MATESEYTSGEGNSSEYEKTKYKLMRGEDLSSAEWKIIRDSTPKVDTQGGKYKTYDTAPF